MNNDSQESRRGRLTGRSFVVTRSEAEGACWAAQIRRLGGEAIVLPCLRTEILGGPETAEALRAALEGAAWLVLSSRRGVNAAADLLEGPLNPAVKVAAVGPRTAEVCNERLGRVDLVAPEGTGRSLAAALAERLGGVAGAGAPDERGGAVAEACSGGVVGRETADPAVVVFAGAEGGGRELERGLPGELALVRRVTLYRTIPSPPQAEREDLTHLDRPVILLASPSAVRGLMGRAVLPEDAVAVTIGPTTTAAARAAGLQVAGEASKRSLKGMLEAIP